MKKPKEAKPANRFNPKVGAKKEKLTGVLQNGIMKKKLIYPSRNQSAILYPPYSSAHKYNVPKL